MKMNIRKVIPSDFNTVEKIIFEAFKAAEYSNGDEHNLVKRLRSADSYIPDLDLVADSDGIIVGHILFSRIIIQSTDGKMHESLALAPVSVTPRFQGQGVGAALIKEGHRIAKELGYTSVILLGHPSYYPRFDYKAASTWGIKAPFDVPDDAFMAVELVAGSLDSISGTVKYPSAFAIE